ncbi:MAG: immunoglobulin domain-containing protein [Bacteroidota bacterium]
MKVKQLYPLIVLLLFFVPKVVFAQPILGTTAEFSLFTTTGDVNNSGSSQLIGNVGTNFGSITGFGNINGTMHDSDGASAQGAVDLAVLYNDLNTSVATFFPAAALGNGQVLTPGVYSIATGATLTADLTLDAQGDPNAVFIIRINGGLTTAANSEVILLDGAAACNVFWQVEGDVALGSGTMMKGTIVANNSDIDIDATANLEGRALSTAGLITVDDILTYTPAGCGAPLLTGPPAPNLLSAACYALLAVDDNMTNTGVSVITGEVGSDNGASVGYDPLFISGTLHLAADASTSQAATDFMNAYTYASSVSPDIQIMFPAQFGNGLILTPHTYVINASAMLSDTLFLDAQNNSTAVFLIQVNGDLTTAADSRIVLLNGADSDNIYWEVDGNVTIGDNSVFRGAIMANNGVITLGTGSVIDGHAFATNGAINTNATTVTIPTLCSPVITAQPIDQTVCAGSTVNFSVTATGAGLTYQWTRGGVNLVDGGNISGATTSTLTITNVTAADDATDYNVIVSGDYEPAATSDNTALVVNTAPNITIQPNDEAICVGDAADFTVTATGTALTYQWMRGGLPLTDAGNISGTTTATLVIDPVDALDAATDYSVVVSGACPSSMASVDVALTINSPVSITTQPADETVCDGSPATFAVVATGTGLTYQWTRGGVNLVNGGNISGATSATLTVNPATSADEATDYNVIVSGACPGVTSADVELTVNDAPVITLQPIDQTVCEGSSVTFTVAATGTGLTYQWRKAGVNLADGGNISGATTSSLTINPITEADEAANYSVVISGACPSSVTSVDAGVVVNNAPVITVQPLDESVCETNIINIAVTATGQGLTYQWTRGGVNLTDGGTITGSTTSVLTISPVATSDAATDYNVIVSGACGSSVTSVDMELTVNTSPVITMEPVDMTVCEGGSVSFTVAATGTDLTYQWYKGGLGLADAVSVSGVNTPTLTIDPVNSIDAGTDYSVVVTGTCPVEDTSVNVSLSINTPPVITLQPNDELVCPGGTATFTVGATGTGLTYQWTRGGVNLADGGNISGATGPVLTVNPVGMGDAASDYNVIVTGSCPSPLTSVDVDLIIGTSPTITVQPADVTVCEGSPATFTVTASGTGLTYQWMRGGVNITDGGSISGATTSSLTINPTVAADAAGDYSVMVSGTCPAAVTSADVSLTINTAPVITVQPLDQTICEGTALTFSVTATGTGLTYQWRRAGVDLADGGNISGTNSSVLTIDPAMTADAATNYSVVVTGACPSPVTSVDAGVVINTAPVITVQPTDQTYCEGSSATLNVTATGTGLTYQWMRGGVNLVDGGAISGATSSSLTINPVTTADAAADYSVMITGACPSPVTSVDAALIINTAPVITVQPADLTVCEGSAATFTVTATGSGLTYQWMKGGVGLADNGTISGATTSTLTIDPTTTADGAPDYSVMVSGACPAAVTSLDVMLVINTSPAITVQPSDRTVCDGSPAIFIVTATGGNLSYQWRRGVTDLVDGGNISGATSSTLTINPATAADADNDYNVVITGSCPGTATSANVSLIIETTPVITVQPVDQTVCEGNPVTFSVTTSSSGLNYQWRRGAVNITDGGNISGATTSSLTIDPANSVDAGTDYNVIVSGTCPFTSTSVNVSLTINTPPVITFQPNGEVVCPGEAADFSVSATGTGLTYQWMRGGAILVNGGNVSGATSSTLVIDPVAAGDAGTDYHVLVSGACPAAVNSVDVSLVINNSPAITTQPVDVTICEGGSASFSVTAPGAGLTYQWMVGGTNLVNGGNISGATTSTLTINPATTADAATDYSVVITGACPTTTTSADVSLTINTAPVITMQPLDQTICEGMPVTFTVAATGTGLTYQWRRAGVNMADGGTISGTNTSSMTINPTTTADEATNYSVVITGACPSAVTSVDAGVVINTAPVITVQPVDMTVCEGTSASFSVSAAGTGLTYQWMVGGVNLVNGGNISGATTSTLTINPAMSADAAADYSVMVSGTCPAAVTSVDAELTINTAPAITVQPADESVCEGSAATFSVTATGVGLTYQWMRGGVNLADGGSISGATTSTLTIDPAMTADADDDYSVMIMGSCPATSANAELIVNVGPPIVVQPVDQNACPGGSVSFTVTASGPVLLYQWMRGGVNLVDGGNISGATTSTLTIDPIVAGDEGTDYSVVVSGGACSTASVDVALNLDDSPAITVQPIDQTVCEGSAATLSVTGTGTGLTYQWMRGGVNLTDGGSISGATTASLTIDPVTMGDDASDYSVMVSGSCPSAVTSVDVDLTVTPATVVTVQPVNQAVCEGNPVSFSVTAAGTAPLTYQWMRGATALTDGGNISGATTSTLTIDPAMSADAGTNYSVMISGACPSVSSANVSLTINTAPVITLMPSNQNVCEGSSVTFTVVATGTGLTYQWRRGVIDMTDNVTVSGTTTSSMTISPVALTDASANYNVVITGTCPSPVTSGNIALTIDPSPIITVQPLSQTVCDGSAASFTVTATGTGLTYQWRKGTTDLVDGGNISGATGTTLTIDPASAADAGTYNVVVTGTCPATSVDVSLNISTSPVITVQPASLVLCPGGAATFGVTASGSNLSYQWTYNGSNLVDGGSYSGCTTAMMVIDPVDASHVGTTYNVIVTGSCPTPVTSANAALALDTAASITVQAVDQTVCDGSPVTFTVEAEGTGLTYQWRRGTSNLANGGSISGATSASLTIDPATAAEAGNNYNVVVSGTCPGSATSDDFTLTVTALPVADASANTDLCVGTDIVLTAQTVSGASYSWSGPDGYTSGNQNPVISSAAISNAGVYTLTVTDNGCSATDDVTVLVNDCDIVAVSIPEGFSPNGDNINDILVIDGIEGYTDNKFMIFNRWGDEVFEGDSYMNTWDGKGPNGEILPVGVYFYILDLGDGSGDKKGTIYLNK